MKKNKNRFINLLLNIAIVLVITLCVGMISFKVVLLEIVVSGTSMEPFLYNMDHGYMIKPTFAKKISRFDIVAVHKNAQSDWIKRVVGLPNEIIGYENGILYKYKSLEADYIQDESNKTLIAEPFIDEDFFFELDIPAFQLEDNEYYVIGDNRKVSARTIVNKSDIFAVGGFINSICQDATCSVVSKSSFKSLD